MKRDEQKTIYVKAAGRAKPFVKTRTFEPMCFCPHPLLSKRRALNDNFEPIEKQLKKLLLFSVLGMGGFYFLASLIL